MLKKIGVALLVGVVFLFAAAYDNATAINPGDTKDGTIKSGEPGAWFKVNVNSAGYLSVIVRAEDDVTLSVFGPVGMEPRLGGADDDLYGDYGAEQMIVDAPGKGTYYIYVAMSGEEAVASGDIDLKLSVSFASQPDLARDIKGDDVTSGAVQVKLGTAAQGSLNFDGGDREDWFKITLPGAGVLTLVLKGESEEIDIDLFLHPKDDPILTTLASSTEMAAEEQLTYQVEEGGTYFIRVKAIDGGEIAYKLLSSFLEF